MIMNTQVKWKKNALSGNIAGTIKPYTQSIPGPFGTPRPLQHYRQGRLIDGDITRLVKSNQYYTIKNIIDKPSSVTITDHCLGLKVEGNYYHNKKFKHDKPFCYNNDTEFSNRFNPENKALQRVRSAPTVLKKTYHQSNASYLKSKCKTFEQNAFHFDEIIKSDSDSDRNMFRPQCNNITCKSVSYNPKNKLFSTNNAVDSSMYMLHRKMEAEKEIYNNNPFKKEQNMNISPNTCGKSLQRNRQYKTLHINKSTKSI